MADNGDRSTREQTLEALREAERTIVITHENPDGDALGSLIAMQEILRALGKDSLMFVDSNEFPLPPEYRFLELPGLVDEPPADLAERTIVFLDCGNLERNPAEAFQRPGRVGGPRVGGPRVGGPRVGGPRVGGPRVGGPPLINIDHHHDNTQFGTINLVVPDAS